VSSTISKSRRGRTPRSSIIEHAGARATWRERRVRDVVLISAGACVLYLLLCLGSHSVNDPGWWFAPGLGVTAPLNNIGGPIGAGLADVLFGLVGYAAWLLPAVLAGVTWMVVSGRDGSDPRRTDFGPALRLVGMVGALVATAALFALRLPGVDGLPEGGGGILGRLVSQLLKDGVGVVAANLFLVALFLVSVTLATGLSWFALMDVIGQAILRGCAVVYRGGQQVSEWKEAKEHRNERLEALKTGLAERAKREPVKIEQAVAAEADGSARAKREQQMPMFAGVGTGSAGVPPLSLLDNPKPQPRGYDEKTLETLSRQIEFKLKDFRIDVEVKQAQPGPVITRFELEPAPGIKVSQINSLDRDIARGLSVKSVRVVDVIPGKSVIGMEIPNASREMIFLSELLRSREYDRSPSLLTLALGKGIGGQPVVADLARMPHLLVAGTTGSGKSVAVNAMVLSLLFKASPQDLRMLMIDPKMLELSVYDGIPHLLAPVVTDMKEAANGLRWCVAEMERRYKLMSAVGVRNLAGFNKKIREEQASGRPLLDPLFRPQVDGSADDAPQVAPALEPLPYIVIFIDEFADMMMIVGKKVEELIARLAQKARAAGIHLILATQRPSVDVITGLIKANIPTRIAFQVSSKIDSRTILDQSGAETLLGHGDMLYLPPGTALPERVHGAFVSDEEVHRVVEHLKRSAQTSYIDGVLDELQPLGEGTVIGATGWPEAGGGDESDPLYDEAVRIVTDTRRASISGVQRRLKIGYNRAARLIEAMEAAGVVTAAESNGERKVLAPPPMS